MRQRPVLVAAPLGLILVLAACGEDEQPVGTAEDPLTVEIDMVDIGYEPDAVDVSTGETVRFVFTNEGDVNHDAFIGDEAAQDAHEDEMRAAEDGDDEMGDMGGDAEDEGEMGGEEDAIVVEPGDTGELTYTFDEPGELLIGCHESGHYAAGMIVTINVS